MKILLLNQTFYPDVVATAQQLSDLAVALVRRGHEVTVVTGRRAYDDPARLFPRTETWQGIKILRLPTTSFGKKAKWRRAVDFAGFSIACCLQLFTVPRPDAVVALTSPPLISFIGAAYARLRRARFFYWVMDLNPDEAIAAGWLREGSLASRLLQWMSRYSFRGAEKIIALDRFMGARIESKGIASGKIAVIPPWSHDDAVRYDAAGREAFRRAHGLSDKFVVMYSGNHSPCHPLDTLLEAAKRLVHRQDIVFCFVGGGSEFRKIQQLVASQLPAPNSQLPTPTALLQSSISNLPTAPSAQREGATRRGSGDERIIGQGEVSNPSPTSQQDIPSPPRSGRGQGEVSNVIPAAPLQSPISHLPSPTSLLPAPCSRLPNVLCLPYQPLNQLSASLSAADVHVVVMGDAFVGTIHPCKVYNVLAVRAPVLYIGPSPSHLSEVLDALNSKVCGRLEHGDVGACVAEIERMASQKLRGEPEPYAGVAHRYSQTVLIPQLVAAIEQPSLGS